MSVLAAIYPATWGFLQIASGALADRVGRKWLVVLGMWVQAGGIALVSVAAGRMRETLPRGVVLAGPPVGASGSPAEPAARTWAGSTTSLKCIEPWTRRK